MLAADIKRSIVTARDIFKNAYLSYCDPETLRVSRKIIDDFTYGQSECLCGAGR